RDAQGHWSVLTTPGASALAVDRTANLYVADGVSLRIRQRDALGTWSDITPRSGLSEPVALAVDTAGNLYVAEQSYQVGASDGVTRVRKRDPQGNWSVLLSSSQVGHPTALAADSAGTLYVAETPWLNPDRGVFRGINRVLKQDAQNIGTEIAPEGAAVGQV